MFGAAAIPPPAVPLALACTSAAVFIDPLHGPHATVLPIRASDLCLHPLSGGLSSPFRYVPGAVHMNVNSQVQIRQLLFPTYCETPSKKFKAANPNYNPEVRPRTPRWLDFEIHGLWGLGQPGRLAVDTTTAKGLPAASSAVLWSLVGKPGAARAALKALDEKEAAERGESSSSSGSATEAEAALVSIHEDDADDGEMLGLDEDDSSGSSSNATNAAAAAAAPEVQLVPGGDLSDEQLAALQAEAASMKLGKMYAAMGGGRAGIEACRALEQLIEVSSAALCDEAGGYYVSGAVT